MSKIRLKDGRFTLVDYDDFYKLDPFNWYLNDNGYVVTDTSKYKRDLYPVKIRLHRLVMLCPNGLDVDHINGDKLDNRKENLRICTRSNNLLNQGIGHASKYTKLKGAYYDKRRDRYFSFIYVNKKQKYIGTFETAEEAHEAYKKASIELHGEFSFFNRGKDE